MGAELFDQLRSLPALSTAAIEAQMLKCKICGAISMPFDIVDLQKVCSEDFYPFGLSNISVPYHRCIDCGFIFTKFFDEWTSKDFAEFIYNSDYIKVDPEYAVDRPKRCAAQIADLLVDPRALKILDYGSGSGAFSKAFDECTGCLVDGYDPYSPPDRPKSKYDVITCFEVIEHTTPPDARS